MKKFLLSVCFIFIFSGFAFSEVFLGLKYGIGETDTNVKKLGGGAGSYEYDNKKSVYAAELGFEVPVSPQTSAAGLKFAYNMFGEVKTKDYKSADDFKNQTYALPMTVYFKFKTSDVGLHFWGGAGITFASMKSEGNLGGFLKTKTKNIIFPHLSAGIEWRFTKFIGLGIDLGYNFNAKIETSDLFRQYKDLTGFQGLLSARLYFQ